jgi:hypothetical protein
VPTDTITMTATRAAIGMIATTSPSPTTTGTREIPPEIGCAASRSTSGRTAQGVTDGEDGDGTSGDRGSATDDARRYLFLRATAQPMRALPRQWRMLADGYDAADLTDFHIRMSAELKTALDAYLAVWLDRAAEVVELRPKKAAPSQPVWSPPRWGGSGLASLGPELLDIDLTLLHDHLRDGVAAIRTLARVAHRSPNHVRWTLQEHPASTGRPILPIDWITELQEVRAEPWRRAEHRRPADSPGKLRNPSILNRTTHGLCPPRMAGGGCHLRPGATSSWSLALDTPGSSLAV